MELSSQTLLDEKNVRSPGSVELSSQTVLDDQNVTGPSTSHPYIKKNVSSQTPDRPPLAAILVIIVVGVPKKAGLF